MIYISTQYTRTIFFFHYSSCSISSIDEEEDVTDDVLLMEAGYVLADALLLKQRRYALHQEEETVH